MLGKRINPLPKPSCFSNRSFTMLFYERNDCCMKEGVKTDLQCLLIRDNEDRKSIDGKLEHFLQVCLHTGVLHGEVILQEQTKLKPQSV